jgi:hypothetical protein
MITVVYGDKMAFFQTQFMNLFFVIFGFMILLPLQTNYITSEYRKNEYHKIYIVTAIFDAISSYLVGIVGMYVSGDYQIILHVLTFVSAVFISPMIFRKKLKQLRYCWKYNRQTIINYLAGVFLLLIGICVCLQGFYEDVFIINVLIFAFAQLISVPSALIKENFLNEEETSIIHLTVWNSVYILLFTNFLLPFQILPYLGNIKPEKLLEEAVYNGWHCFTGTFPKCENGRFLLIVYSFFIFLEYMLINLFNKESASYMFGVNVIVIPLTILCFGIPLLGENIYQSITINIVIGTIIAIVGIMKYKSCEDKIKEIDIETLEEYENIP